MSSAHASIVLLLLTACAAMPSPSPGTNPAPSSVVVVAPTSSPPASAIAASAPVTPPSAQAAVTPAPQPADYFRVEIEQNGAPLSAQEHEVVLDRKPFVIAVHFRSPDTVSVNASTSSRWFDIARTGGSFELGNSSASEAPFAMGRGLAEAEVHPDPDLFLTDQGSHYWYYDSDQAHRCSSVANEGGGGVLCRRRVERLGSGEPVHYTPVAAFKGAAIHLVFLGATAGTEAKNWIDRSERQRFYMRLKLR